VELFVGISALRLAGRMPHTNCFASLFIALFNSNLDHALNDSHVGSDRNVCHGSDSVESAEKEIAHWFPEGVCAWESCEQSWVYE
jgi:hypothetical protein